MACAHIAEAGMPGDCSHLADSLQESESFMVATVANQSRACTSLHIYYLYGLCVRSQWPLPCPHEATSSFADVELFKGDCAFFSKALREAGIQPDVAGWSYYAQFQDGTEYVRWNELFEFMISANGHRIAGRPLAAASLVAFQTYLLGQVISYAVIKLGFEPLHATVVVIDGGAVGFLGHSGYGKSSLGAAFLEVGFSVLTDDLLVLREEGKEFLAYPGTPRIKLFPEVAQMFLGGWLTAPPMNPYTDKLVIPLDPKRSSKEARPLKAFYVLPRPSARPRGNRIRIRRRPQQKACVDVISNTFNTHITRPERLAQQFDLASRLAAGVPVKSLSYPRDLARLREVVKAVCADLT
jgi:hypothetical protein